MSLTLLAVYGMMFLGAVLLLEGLTQVLFLFRNPEQKAINRRLRVLESGYDPEETYRLLRRRAGQEGWLAWSPIRRLDTYLHQAGVELSVMTLLAALFALVAVGGLVLTFGLRLAPVSAAVLSAAIVIGAAAMLLGTRRRKRLAALETQLPELLDLIVRSVRSGHPLTTSLRLAANEVADPLGSEVRTVVSETTYGIPLVDAIENLSRRIGMMDYAYFAVVAKITSKTGGNLAAILDNLSISIRERGKMRRKIKAISAEGRVSGLVMSLAPIVISGLIFLTSPNFFLDVKEDPLFDKLVLMIFSLITFNYLALRRLVNFEI
ncbi:MAG: type II secretion system F family protein [Pseudomonadota bacterium]